MSRVIGITRIPWEGGDAVDDVPPPLDRPAEQRHRAPVAAGAVDLPADRAGRAGGGEDGLGGVRDEGGVEADLGSVLATSARA